jgi:RNA polymerase sigma factor (sigma-70 family)
MLYLLFAFNLKPRQLQHLSDEEIVERIIITQDISLVEILYQRYADKVYRKCLSFVKEEASAEDLTHDIFMKLYLNLSSFKQKSKFSTWLYSITYNFCIDHIRKKQKEKWVDIDENESDEVKDYMVDSIEDMSHIAVDRLSNLLEKIKTDEKMILLMKYRDDMSIKDIQSVLKISESAVKMRIKRAKEKIQSLYHIQYKESV